MLAKHSKFVAMVNLRPGTCALVIVDVQKAIDVPYWAALGFRNNPDAERAMASVLAAWRDAGQPVFHVRHDSRNPTSSYLPGQPGHAFKDEVLPVAGEPVISKTTNSAFIGTDLERSLAARGIRRLCVMGVITNNSVETTVRMAGNLGFETYLVEDCCFTFPKRDYRGVLRSAEEVHALSLANLDGEYCTVITSPEAIAAVAKPGKGAVNSERNAGLSGPAVIKES